MLKRFVLSCLLGVGSVSAVNAQEPAARLDQVALVRKFVGLWRLDAPGDTVFYLEQRPFGDTAFIVTTWTVVRGKRVGEGRRVYGYDGDSRRYVGALVGNRRSRLGLLSFWFTSETRCEGNNYRDAGNPNGSLSRHFVVEFTSPDRWVQTNMYPDGRAGDTESFVRVKK
jgi:hypothetical protein